MARRRSLLAALGGVGTGVALCAVLVLAGVLESETSVSAEEVQEEFLAAWEAHRRGTFVVEAEWRRVNPDTDAELVSAALLVQQPPDRVLRQFGGARGRLDGREVRCNTALQDDYRCVPSSRPLVDFDEEIAGELEIFRQYFAPPLPLYAVHRGEEGCFELVQVTPFPDPPYGSEATMCFDQETGAMRYLRRQLEFLFEEYRAVSIRAAVLPTDFDLTDDERYRAGGDLPPPGVIITELPGEVQGAEPPFEAQPEAPPEPPGSPGVAEPIPDAGGASGLPGTR